VSFLLCFEYREKNSQCDLNMLIGREATQPLWGWAVAPLCLPLQGLQDGRGKEWP
jgi:hypothetical protein